MPHGVLGSCPMAETTNAATYGDWLRDRMEERSLTQRQLGKLLNPDNPEVARRAIRRYLKGMTPIERTRQSIASVLGTDELGPDGSDEEDD